jgi:hypothetical protein
VPDGVAAVRDIACLETTVEDYMAAEEHALFPFAAKDLAGRRADLWDEMSELHWWHGICSLYVH